MMLASPTLTAAAVTCKSALVVTVRTLVAIASTTRFWKRLVASNTLHHRTSLARVSIAMLAMPHGIGVTRLVATGAIKMNQTVVVVFVWFVLALDVTAIGTVFAFGSTCYAMQKGQSFSLWFDSLGTSWDEHKVLSVPSLALSFSHFSCSIVEASCW